MITVSRSRNGRRVEPHWPAVVAMLAIAGLYAALPPTLLSGAPGWLLVAAVGLLLIAITIARHRRNVLLSQFLGYILNGLVTLGLIVSLAMLVVEATQHNVTP